MTEERRRFVAAMTQLGEAMADLIEHAQGRQSPAANVGELLTIP